MKKLEEYQKEFNGLTAGEAIDILVGLQGEKDQIIIPVDTGNIITTPLKLCFKTPCDVSAAIIGPFQFCGGPPGRYGWVSGTLLTMVIDKVMHYDSTEETRERLYGTKVAVKV